MNIRIVLSLVVLLYVGGTPIFAYPGKVALAYPVAGIAVDGDLSDWPEGLVRYPILHNADGAGLFGEGDFQGEFLVGYSESENALYVAVDIRDDYIVRVPVDGIMSQQWNAQDGCELYLFSHKPGEDAPTQYRLWGEDLGMYGPGNLEEVQASLQWREDGYRIEWRIDLTQASGQRIELRPGMQLGFDLSVWDRDEHGEPSWMAWSKGIDKYQRADRLGNVVLVPAGAGLDDVIAQLDAINEGREGPLGSPLVGGTGFSAGYQMFFSGVLLSITFLHFLLFLFNRSTRANLFYALYTAAIGAAIFSGLQLEFHSYMDPLMVRVAKETAILVINLFGLIFLFALFGRVPKRFYFELVVFIIPAALGTVVLLNFDSQGLIPFNGAFEVNRLVLRFTNLFLLVETVLVLIGGVRRIRT